MPLMEYTILNVQCLSLFSFYYNKLIIINFTPIVKFIMIIVLE